MKAKIYRALERLLVVAVNFFAVAAAYVFVIYAMALLPGEKLIGGHCLPNHLKNKLHADYLVARKIPFSATAACFVEPPVQVLGSQNFWAESKSGIVGPKPIPPRGEWQLSLIREKKNWPVFIPYFAITGKDGWHFRIGCRWDDIDHYYVFPSVSVILEK